MDFGLFVEFAAPEGTTDRDTFSQGFALVELAPNIESYRTAWKERRSTPLWQPTGSGWLPVVAMWWGALAALQHEFGDAFADHHGGDVGVGPDAVGHDGRIDDADAVQSVDLAKLVNHGHGI